MSTAITLKNIPDDIYRRLKEVAEIHRRSVNSEAIACLERALLPTKVSVDERLSRARQLRAAVKGKPLKAKVIAAVIAQGRK
jgi:plasmid stability protein